MNEIDENFINPVVSTEASETIYRQIQDGLIYFEKTIAVSKPFHLIDAFPNFWALAMGEVGPGQLAFHNDGLVPVQGPSAMFVPPFSIIEWVVKKPATYRWSSFCSNLPLPPGLPREPVVFPLSATERPRDYDGILRMLGDMTNSRTVGKTAEGSPVAARLKKRIDAEYCLNKNIADYASELGISHEVMTRYFKSTFGLPPTEYRGKLRLFEAMFRMLMLGEPVNKVCFDVGFENLRSFNRLFKKYMAVQPSRYHLF